MTQLPSILDRIFASKRRELNDLNPRIAEVKSKAADAPPPRGFLRALTASAQKPGLIAEVKKGSPTKGTIRHDFDEIEIAKTYERAGASCLSVLTDVEFFQGAPEYLASCRSATNIPVLRKDFTAGEYHVYEARALSADAILLIVNGLSSAELVDYRLLAESLRMDVLVEAHSLAEAEAAIESGATLVGINNRDLKTFAIDIETSELILPKLVGKATLVSESALQSRDDVTRVTRAGATAVLIGTAFTSSPDIAAAVGQIMPW